MWSFDGGFSIPADASGHLAIEYTWIYKPFVLWNEIAGNNEGIQRWNHRSFTKAWLFSQQSLKGMCVCLKKRYIPQIHWFIISFLMASATSLGKSHVMKPVKVMVHCRSWKCSRPFGEAVARCSAPVAMLRFPALNSKISMPMSRSKRWRTSNLDQIKPHMAPLCHENSGFHQSKIWIFYNQCPMCLLYGN